MGRVTSIRCSISPTGGAAISFFLAAIATIAIPVAVSSAPLDGSEPEGPPRAATAGRGSVVGPRDQAPEKAKAASKSAVGFQLANAELIHVRVRGQGEFSGDYRINPDTTISLPRLGRVNVGSMTANDLELYLGERLSASLRQDVGVSVEVVRFRPFFMTGQVSSPGLVEWRPDLTLIQAISLSGGVSRVTSAASLDTPERRLLLEQARVRHGFAVAQLARVSAEKLGKDSVETEQLLSVYIAKALPESREALERFLGRQNQLLGEQRAAHESRLAGLMRERESVLLELEAARAQSDEVKLQVELTESQMEGIESLKLQRLLTNTRYLDYRRALAEIRVRYSESIQLVQRARARYNALERDMVILRSERDALLNDRIEGLEREIAELELTLGGPSGLFEAGLGQSQPSLTYHIARRTGTGVRTFAANLFTEVHPGDVVIVSSKQQTRSTAPNSLKTVTNSTDALKETQRIMEGAVSPIVPGMVPATPHAAAGGSRPAAAHPYSFPRQPTWR